MRQRFQCARNNAADAARQGLQRLLDGSRRSGGAGRSVRRENVRVFAQKRKAFSGQARPHLRVPPHSLEHFRRSRRVLVYSFQKVRRRNPPARRPAAHRYAPVRILPPHVHRFSRRAKRPNRPGNAAENASGVRFGNRLS